MVWGARVLAWRLCGAPPSALPPRSHTSQFRSLVVLTYSTSPPSTDGGNWRAIEPTDTPRSLGLKDGANVYCRCEYWPTVTTAGLVQVMGKGLRFPMGKKPRVLVKRW